VKTVTANALGDDIERRSFFKELLTWVELPAHPHLTACRFYRTAEDKIAVFAELVPGNSLATWIVRRQVASLDRILDIAIQSARGVHALHHLGLVHQDIKPSNVLMTEAGTAKITDFGLARARRHADGFLAGQRQDSLLSRGGM